MKSHKHKDNIKEDDKLNTFVGTKEYVSPEVLKGTGCSPAADMWSLGVIIFQLYTGTTPFFVHGSEYFTFQNIMNCKFEIPSSIPKEGRDLIERLLIFEPKDRLSAAEVKSHPFFEGFNFEIDHNVDSPLCPLYNLIKENEVCLKSSEEDSFVEDEHFDEDFNYDESYQYHNPHLKLEVVKESPPKNGANYIKKSSSLGEKDIKELTCEEDEEKVETCEDQHDTEDEKNTSDQNWSRTIIIQNDTRGDLSNEFTFESALSPTIMSKTDLLQIRQKENVVKPNDGKKIVVLEGHIK